MAMNPLQKRILEIQKKGRMIQGGKNYVEKMDREQRLAFGNLSGPEAGGFDYLDADDYRKAWNNSLQSADESMVPVVNAVESVWSKIAEQSEILKDGFTSVLDIAYVTADGIAELWALYKWVGGPSEFIELQRKRNSNLVERKKNSRKYGPFYVRDENGQRPMAIPKDAKGVELITFEEANRMQTDNPDFIGTHSILGIAQATWKYYLPGFDGVVPDWRNPSHYPQAVLYWYYDSQIEKMQEIAKDFDDSSLGQTRDWLFERGTLMQAWLSGGWVELYNLKQMVDQNYRIAKARTELLGHEAAVNIEGSDFLTGDGEEIEGEDITVLGIKSANQVVMEKIEKLRKMFPYNAKAYMGPQMWFFMHDLRQKKKDKNYQPYPLLMLDDKIEDYGMMKLRQYLQQEKQNKIDTAEEAFETSGIPTESEINQANAKYDSLINALDNMPTIFIEGMMSAFGGRAGRFYTLDADKQFGDFAWLNSNAFSIEDKPDRPRSMIIGYDEDEQPIRAVVNNWLTGRIGNTMTEEYTSLGSQPDINLRGWGWGTRFFSPMGTDEKMKMENFGSMFDWHPFNGLWCHDGQTHLAGQFSVANSATIKSTQKEDYAISQSDMQNAYITDYWNWNDSILVEPRAYSAINGKTADLSGNLNFLLRKNKRIVDLANSGKFLKNSNRTAPPIANTRFSADNARISLPASMSVNEFASYERTGGASSIEISTGIFGSLADDSSGLWNLMASPIQSIFAAGISGSKAKSIWLASDGKTFNSMPVIGHGRKVRTASNGLTYLAAFTNYHSIMTTTYHPTPMTTDDNRHGNAAGWGNKDYSTKKFYNLYDAWSDSDDDNQDIADGLWSNTNTTAIKATNWLAISDSPFSGLPTSITPGLGSPWDFVRTGNRCLYFTVTPPIETYGFTGLSPKPGIYNSQERFPGNHEDGFVATESFLGNSRTAVDYSDPLFSALISDKGNQLNPSDPSTKYRTIMNPIRKTSHTSIDAWPGFGSNNLDIDLLDMTNNSSGYRSGNQSEITQARNKVDPFTAAANFNYAKVSDSNKIARLLKQQWSFYPDSHQHLARIISELRLGRKLNRKRNMDNTYEYKTTNGMTLSQQAKVAPQIVQSWSIQQIEQALNTTYMTNRNRKLIDSLRLAEPDNNPLGMWLDLKDPSHEFFGITDLEKMKQNSSVIIDGETVSTLTEADLWNVHRALEFKDEDALDKDTIDWFNSKVTKYGWAHIMEGVRPMAISEMKSPAKLPRYWAPLFLPFRQINDFAPRLYYGCEELTENVYPANPHAIYDNITSLGNTPLTQIIGDEGFYIGGRKYDRTNFSEASSYLAVSPIKESTNGETRIVVYSRIGGGIRAEEITVDNGQEISRTTIAVVTSSLPPGAGSPAEYILSEIMNHTDNFRGYGVNAMPYRRTELVGGNPIKDETDDIRLLGAFALTPESDINQKMNILGDHWSQQFSWLNAGWYGFDTIEQAEMFLANQFKESTVTFEDESYNWKGMLNGPPVGTIGFGPIDELIDFVRYFDSIIMQKVDMERLYESALNRYEGMKSRLDKIAEFQIDILPAGIDDILSGRAKVVGNGQGDTKTYRWLPVFGQVRENSIILSAENAAIINEYMEMEPESLLIENPDLDTYPAAKVSPEKFVFGVIVEQQPENELNEMAEWYYSNYYEIKGDKNVVQTLAENDYPNAPNEALLPWVVNGEIIRKSVKVTGGVFQQWEHALTSDKSPFGRFLKKIKNFEIVMQTLWNGKVPGFNSNMKDFWNNLEEENTMIQDFLIDLQKSVGFAAADHPSTSAAIMNINQRIDEYVGAFDQMSKNWSDSMQAMNTYAEYMAQSLYSLNQKFEYAIDAFTGPYQSFEDVIDNSNSIIDFNKMVEQLDRIFEKNNNMNAMMGNKLEFKKFKNKAIGTRLAARKVIDAINNSGLAEIRPTGNAQKGNSPPIITKTWLDIPPPPIVNLQINTDFEISPEYTALDLPSAELDYTTPTRVNVDMVDPTIYSPIEDTIETPNYSIEPILEENAMSINMDPLDIAERIGEQAYLAVDEGFPRKITEYGQNDIVVETYTGEELPTNPQTGDRWIDPSTGNEFFYQGNDIWSPSISNLNGPRNYRYENY